MGESIATVGKISGVCGHTGTAWEKVGVSASDRLLVETESPDGTDLKDILDELIDILTELETKLETSDLNLDLAKDLQVDVKTLPDSSAQIRRGNHVTASYDAVPGDTSVHDLINVSGAGTLEWLNLASDNHLTRIYIILDGDATYAMYTVTPTDVAYHAPLYYATGIGEGSLFKRNVYDADTDEYSIFLKRPLWFNTSLKVQYKAPTNADKVVCNAGYHLF